MGTLVLFVTLVFIVISCLSFISFVNRMANMMEEYNNKFDELLKILKEK